MIKKTKFELKPFSNGCQECTCVGGQWVCEDKGCDSICVAYGDPHYTTFDGKRYNFQGNCVYYLVKEKGKSVESNNDFSIQVRYIYDNNGGWHQGASHRNFSHLLNNHFSSGYKGAGVKNYK